MNIFPPFDQPPQVNECRCGRAPRHAEMKIIANAERLSLMSWNTCIGSIYKLSFIQDEKKIIVWTSTEIFNSSFDRIDRTTSKKTKEKAEDKTKKQTNKQARIAPMIWIHLSTLAQWENKLEKKERHKTKSNVKTALFVRKKLIRFDAKLQKFAGQSPWVRHQCGRPLNGPTSKRHGVSVNNNMPLPKLSVAKCPWAMHEWMRARARWMACEWNESKIIINCNIV